MDPVSCIFPLCCRLYYVRSAGPKVAADEDILFAETVILYLFVVLETFEGLFFRPLAYRRDEVVRLHDVLGSCYWHGAPAPRFVGLTEDVSHQFHGLHFPPAVSKNLDGGGEVGVIDPFHLHLLQFVPVDVHFRLGPSVDELHIFCAKADRASHAVDGGEAPTDHEHPIGNLVDHLLVDLHHEVEPQVDPFSLLPGNPYPDRIHRAKRYHDGVVFPGKVGKGDIVAERHLRLQVDAQVENGTDVEIGNLLREPEFRYPQGHHPPRDILLLEEGDVVSPQGELVRSGQTGRSGANNGNPFPRFGFPLPGFRYVEPPEIPGDPLKVADRHGISEPLVSVPAGRLAGAGAHSAQYPRENIVPPVDFVAAGVISLRYSVDVGRDVGGRRAKGPAGDVLFEPPHVFSVP